jgi:hypothetical protein
MVTVEGMKVLILDKATTKIVSMVYSQVRHARQPCNDPVT